MIDFILVYFEIKKYYSHTLTKLLQRKLITSVKKLIAVHYIEIKTPLLIRKIIQEFYYKVQNLKFYFHLKFKFRSLLGLKAFMFAYFELQLRIVENNTRDANMGEGVVNFENK